MFCRQLTAIKHHLARHISVSSALTATTKQIPTYSNIKITSNFHLAIKPYDVVDCPDSNLLRISLQPRSITTPPSTKIANAIANFQPVIEVNDQNITVDTLDSFNHQLNVDELSSHIYCLIEVPIRANLKVLSQRDVHIDNMHSDDINVNTNEGNIATKSVHATNLNLISQHGAIHCSGSTLSQKMDLRTHGDKPIHVQKALGDSLTAITEDGTISTDSCYSEHSKFITQKGGLHLKNVHKASELIVLDGGEVNVTGFHGHLQARTNGGKLNFQLTEIYGDSFIEAQNPNSFILNISEFVEQHTCLSIAATTITLDPNVSEFNVQHSNGTDKLESGNRDLIPDQLSIQTNGKLNLGKLSWMEAIQLKFAATAKETTT